MPKNIMIIMAPTPATKQPWQQAPQNTATNDSCCLDNPCRELVETRSTTARPPIGFQSGNREGPARSCRRAVCPAFLLGRRPQGLQDTARAQASGHETAMTVRKGMAWRASLSICRKTVRAAFYSAGRGCGWPLPSGSAPSLVCGQFALSACEPELEC